MFFCTVPNLYETQYTTDCRSSRFVFRWWVLSAIFNIEGSRTGFLLLRHSLIFDTVLSALFNIALARLLNPRSLMIRVLELGSCSALVVFDTLLTDENTSSDLRFFVRTCSVLTRDCDSVLQESESEMRLHEG